MISSFLVAGLLLGVILPAISSPTNCGGNSYALSACRQFVTMTQLAAKDGKFDITAFGEADNSEAAKLAQSHWVRRADFLVRTNFANSSTPPLVVIVCEGSFDNVPQPAVWNFYHKNPAHAVGYSDGTTGLISPAEFKALDQTGFIYLSSLGTNISGQSIQP